MPDEKPAESVAEVPAEVAADIHDAGEAVADAAATATEKGEDGIAATLSAFESRIKALEDRTGAPSVTQASEVVAKPVEPVEETAEAVAPEIKVRPRKPHYINRLPKWL